MYLPFWEKFIAKDNVAVFELKDSWINYFDVVTSFFSLEHVEDPAGMMQKVSQVLKNDGYFYCIVPNMYVNPADFIVADHVNHFSVYSIFSLMDIAGFNVIDIDTTSHYGAIILVAQKTRPEKKKPERLETDKQDIARSATEISSFWTDILNKINKFENEAGESDKAAIYGSGFYGALILSTLKNPDVVKYFVDQNIYKQGNMLFDKKIVAPSELPEDIQIVYVGLNPSVAKNSIHAIEDWKDRAYHYCYL